MHIDESKKLDKRTIERKLKEGIVSPKEWEAYLKSLPDVSENADFLMIVDGKNREVVEEKQKAAEDKEVKSEESAEKLRIPESD
jgi:tRNA U34 5-carboxymethylaminomethyl modifying enzyme MnmG/GidA